MIEIKELRATWTGFVAYLVVALALLMLLSGIMSRWTDWRIQQRDVVIEALQRKIAVGQQIIGQINLPERTADVLRQVGWQVREQQTRGNTNDQE